MKIVVLLVVGSWYEEVVVGGRKGRGKMGGRKAASISKGRPSKHMPPVACGLRQANLVLENIAKVARVKLEVTANPRFVTGVREFVQLTPMWPWFAPSVPVSRHEQLPSCSSRWIYCANAGDLAGSM